MTPLDHEYPKDSTKLKLMTKFLTLFPRTIPWTNFDIVMG
jgi:hypothetical protein